MRYQVLPPSSSSGNSPQHPCNRLHGFNCMFLLLLLLLPLLLCYCCCCSSFCCYLLLFITENVIIFFYMVAHAFCFVTEKINRKKSTETERNVEVQKIEIYIHVFPNDCIASPNTYTQSLSNTHTHSYTH